MLIRFARDFSRTALLLLVVSLVAASCGFLDSEEQATPTPSSTPVPDLPTLAPNGRTGDAALDAVIETAITGDAGEIAAASAGARATLFVDSEVTARMTTQEWSQRLAGKSRSLYAVYRDGQQDIQPRTDYLPPARDVTILINAGTESGDVEEHWSLAVRDGLVVDALIVIADQFPRIPPSPGRDRGVAPPATPPGVAQDYERYLVLPPASDLPVAPPGHDLTVRTGDSDVDSILASLEAGDARAIISSLVMDELPCGPGNELRCPQDDAESMDALPLWRPDRGLSGPFFKPIDRSAAEELLQRVGLQAYSLVFIARVPDGYEPAPGFVAEADHLIVLNRMLGPYWWEPLGLFERDGHVVGVAEGNGRSVNYPTAFIVPPPAGDWLSRLPDNVYLLKPAEMPTELSAVRLSGIPELDGFLEAANELDTETLESMTEFSVQVPCAESDRNSVTIGDIRCRESEEAGTGVNVLPVEECGYGGYLRDQGTYASLGIHDHAPLPLTIYAVVEDDELIAVLVPTTDDGEIHGWDAVALRFKGGQVVEAYRSCSARTYASTDNGLPWPQYGPEFLLGPIE